VVKRWVVNASPLISLTKIDRIHLLSELCDEVHRQPIAPSIDIAGQLYKVIFQFVKDLVTLVSSSVQS